MRVLDDRHLLEVLPARRGQIAVVRARALALVVRGHGLGRGQLVRAAAAAAEQHERPHSQRPHDHHRADRETHRAALTAATGRRSLGRRRLGPAVVARTLLGHGARLVRLGRLRRLPVRVRGLRVSIAAGPAVGVRLTVAALRRLAVARCLRIRIGHRRLAGAVRPWLAPVGAGLRRRLLMAHVPLLMRMTVPNILPDASGRLGPGATTGS
ncbi:hypothetical protein SANT12839_036000 [Streptomyces antimycoticus]|uniref:Uncharacterized protein n=1 Tax=Streptomyces antimycoticus TaxID=68175 RepID=A0A4D4K7U0_9ACTN|nr:hypothetical protein SANT12839_036000 [Streptomyces antimycoticus]